MAANDTGNWIENFFAHAGVAIIAAAMGVWGGVKVHGVEILEIKRRLEAIEGKLDRLIDRELDR